MGKLTDTTPDPITTAREALDKAYEVCRNLGGTDDADFHAISAAIDYAQKIKAERDEALTAHEDRGFDCERLRQDNTRLTSQLEQAERVIAPFAEALRIADVSGQPIGYHIGVEPCQRASQWIKDRQAKTDAAIGDK